jgi:hypothetical protein
VGKQRPNSGKSKGAKSQLSKFNADSDSAGEDSDKGSLTDSEAEEVSDDGDHRRKNKKKVTVESEEDSDEEEGGQ